MKQIARSGDLRRDDHVERGIGIEASVHVDRDRPQQDRREDGEQGGPNRESARVRAGTGGMRRQRTRDTGCTLPGGQTHVSRGDLSYACFRHLGVLEQWIVIRDRPVRDPLCAFPSRVHPPQAVRSLLRGQVRPQTSIPPRRHPIPTCAPRGRPGEFKRLVEQTVTRPSFHVTRYRKRSAGSAG